MLERILEPAKEIADDKLKDPYLRAFILSSVIWNYQVILYIFSDLAPDTKFALIQHSLNIWSLIGPIALSFFYNLAFPVIFYFFYCWTDKLNVWVTNAREKELLNLSTHKQILQFHESKIRELNEMLSQRDQEKGRQEQKHETETALLRTEYNNEISKLKATAESQRNKAADTYRSKTYELQSTIEKLEKQNKFLESEIATHNAKPAVKAWKTLTENGLLEDYLNLANGILLKTQPPLPTGKLRLLVSTFSLITFSDQIGHDRSVTRMALTAIGKEVIAVAEQSSLPKETV